MGALDILKSYLDRPTDTHQDFDDVVRELPTDELGGGLSAAFKSDRTPDFGSMVGSLFGGSDGQQRAGLLGQLMRSLGPTVLAGLGGGGLDRLLKSGKLGQPSENGAISVEDANVVSEAQVRDIAAAAEKSDPSVMDRVGAYYAQHPEVVKVLGGAALAVILGQIARRQKR